MTARTKQFAALGLGILILVGFTLAVSAGLDYFLTHRGAPPATTPPVEPQPLPPEPRLQVAPSVELEKLRKEEEERLKSYGWVDRKERIVHIPIDKAVEVLLERGLPVRSQARDANKE